MLRRAAIGIASLAAAVAVTLTACSGAGDGRSGPSELDRVTPAAVDPAAFTSATTVAPLGPPAASPRAAVEGFLAAEIAGDRDASFVLLAALDRAKLVTPTAWRAAHTNLPDYVSSTVRAAGSDGSVVTDVTLRPRLDPVTGVFPASATITWRPVAEDGGWRIDLSATSVEAHYPADTGAAPAALAWVRARQSCASDPAAARLLFDPDLAGALCHEAGSFQAAAPAPLSTLTNPAAVVDAYGPDASTFARVVRLSGPRTLDVVTAPLGATWVVIGVTG